MLLKNYITQMEAVKLKLGLQITLQISSLGNKLLHSEQTPRDHA